MRFFTCVAILFMHFFEDFCCWKCQLRKFWDFFQIWWQIQYKSEWTLLTSLTVHANYRPWQVYVCFRCWSIFTDFPLFSNLGLDYPHIYWPFEGSIFMSTACMGRVCKILPFFCEMFQLLFFIRSLGPLLNYKNFSLIA